MVELVNEYNKGLGNHLNLSTAEDVGKLCSIVSKDPLIS